jgi:hypothetical protein
VSDFEQVGHARSFASLWCIGFTWVCWFYFKTLFQNVRECKEESWGCFVVAVGLLEVESDSADSGGEEIV